MTFPGIKDLGSTWSGARRLTLSAHKAHVDLGVEVALAQTIFAFTVATAVIFTGGIAIPVLFFVCTDGIALTAVLGKVTNAVAIAHPQGLTAWATCHVLLEDASERDRIVEEVLDGTQLSLNWGGLGFQRHQPLRVIDVALIAALGEKVLIERIVMECFKLFF